MTQLEEYKVYCKICDKECLWEARYQEHYCDKNHYKFKSMISGSFVEFLYYGPYTMVKCNGWEAYEVWFHPYFPVKNQAAEQFLFNLNLNESNFKSEKYVVDKIKSLHIFC